MWNDNLTIRNEPTRRNRAYIVGIRIFAEFSPLCATSHGNLAVTV